MRIAVIGASGFIGRHLRAALRERGDTIVTATLRMPEAAARSCDGADAVVNLAGEDIAHRWTRKLKAAIWTSRVDAPHAMIEHFGSLAAPPKAYISASAVGYYGTSESATFTEKSPPGRDFLAGVCAAWESTADEAARFGARVTKVRTGLALGPDGGALSRLLPIFRMGGGGVIASGRQWHSWIHIDDIVGIYLSAIDGVEGVLNATAPTPIHNAEFVQALSRVLNRPAVVPVPELALRLMLGDGAMVLTEGQRVLPERTLATGYAYKHTTIDEALRALLSS